MNDIFVKILLCFKLGQKRSLDINIKMDKYALKQVSKFKYLGSTITQDGKNREDIMQRIREAELMFNNKKTTIMIE
jgi:hypothetical protein